MQIVGRIFSKRRRRSLPGNMKIHRKSHFKDRNHQVCDTRIYQLLRHPGYAGMILSLAAFPLLTGSAWSMIPMMIAIMLLLIRTALEDRTLQSELAGYKQYAQKSKYKIIPFI